MNDELKHYGVPGMKWGVRKDKKNGRSSKKGYTHIRWNVDAIKNDYKKDNEFRNKISRNTIDVIGKPKTMNARKKFYDSLDKDPEYLSARKAAQAANETFEYSPTEANDKKAYEAYKHHQNIMKNHLKDHKNEIIEAMLDDMNIGKGIQRTAARELLDEDMNGLLATVMRDDDWNTAYHSDEDMEEWMNELKHYGVPGMKWGVRRNASRAYAKSMYKQRKLDDKVEKKRVKSQKADIKAHSRVVTKYQKLQAKADKAQYKADKTKYSMFTSAEKAAYKQAMADRKQFKADKYKYRAEKKQLKATKAKGKYLKAVRKSEKWKKTMDKTFKDIPASDIKKGEDILREMING